MVILPLILLVTYCDLESVVHTASRSFPIDISDMCVILIMMWPSHASSGKAGKSSKHGLIDCMVCIFGHTT